MRLSARRRGAESPADHWWPARPAVLIHCRLELRLKAQPDQSTLQHRGRPIERRAVGLVDGENRVRVERVEHVELRLDLLALEAEEPLDADIELILAAEEFAAGAPAA